MSKLIEIYDKVVQKVKEKQPNVTIVLLRLGSRHCPHYMAFKDSAQACKKHGLETFIHHGIIACAVPHDEIDPLQETNIVALCDWPSKEPWWITS